ncbi:hypothetical protein BH24ACT5_BH24ACT5_03240 [soil metagenome]
MRSPIDPNEQVRALLRRSIAPFDATGSADDWKRRASDLRRRALDDIFLKGIDRALIDSGTRIEWGEVIDVAPRYRIRKLRYEALPSYWIPALLYEPVGTSARRRAAVINADGHHDAGNAAVSKQIRCVNLALRGVVALSFEFLGMGELGGDSDYDPNCGASLHSNLCTHELVGIGAPAAMYVAMHHALQIVLDHPDVDTDRVVMTGLSGGGWQTIVLAAMDQRIAGAVPVAGYTAIRSRIECDDDIGDLEQVPADMAVILDYPEMTAMLAPRPTLILLNEWDDCCFRPARTKPAVYDAVRPVFDAFGAADAFSFHSSREPGDHNFGPDNRRQLYRFLTRHFGVEGPEWDVHLPSDVQPEHTLRVGLPTTQRSLIGIARRRARELSVLRRERGPESPAMLRQRLRAVLRVPEDAVEDDQFLFAAAADDAALIDIGPWTLKVHWSGRRESTNALQLDVSDGGAATAAPHAPSVARCGVDILGTGWSALASSRTAMLSAASHRMLGIQVGQVLAIAEALHTLDLPLRIVGSGVVTSVVTTFSVALRPDLFVGATVDRAHIGSLEDLIGKGIRYREAASLFCPDLLTITDLPEVMPLLADVQWSDSRSGASTPP